MPPCQPAAYWPRTVLAVTVVAVMGRRLRSTLVFSLRTSFGVLLAACLLIGGVRPAAASVVYDFSLGANGERTQALPPGVKDVRGLIAHLRNQGAPYTEAFSDESRIRVAVNQRHAGFDPTSPS